MQANENAGQRTVSLIGQDGVCRLKNSAVAVVGLGGVGGICSESLARAGIGKLVLIDKDTIEPSNMNRQVAALHSTIGLEKTEIMRQRILDINPDCEVICYQAFYDKNMNEDLSRQNLDFVIDCIDSLKSKKDLIQYCIDRNIPFLVSTGTARKKDPSRLKIAEIEKTSYDPLAKNLRIWKRKNRIRNKIMTVFSDEKPAEVKSGQPLPSMMFVPASAGLLLASTCIQQLLAK